MSHVPSPPRDPRDPPAAAAPSDSANALVAVTAPPALDDYDPADYDWVPVRRQPRRDGWTIATQRQFIETLADTGSVTQAAQAVNMTPASCYRLRRAPDARAFAAAWAAALHAAALRLEDMAFDRAVHGSPEPVFDRAGNRVGQRMRYNDRLLMFLLRAHGPARYDPRHAPAAPPEPATPVEAALAALAPPMPDAPHRLMAPEDAIDAMRLADALDGATPVPRRDPACDPMPLGPAFEAALAAARDDASRA